MVLTAFHQAIEQGLSASSKYISSQFFYDDQGSRIFQDIMRMPEYYPTACEFEILSFQSLQIINKLDFSEPFNIVELGAGDGIKTLQLLRKLTELGAFFHYVPIDISAEAIHALEENMSRELPGLSIKSLVGDYFTQMEVLAQSDIPCLFLFLGGNIGNYEGPQVHDLLKQFYQNMKPGDKLLTGFDLQKNPITIRRAYDDSQGITKAFNLNLLHRINREMGGTFLPDQFDFYCYYNPDNGEVRSYLVSLRDQDVYIDDLERSFHFDQNELIWTELSRKYTFQEIEQLARQNGFKVVNHFLDCKHYFTDSLWVK